MLVIRSNFKLALVFVFGSMFSCQEIPYDLNEPKTIYVNSSFQNEIIPYFSIFYTNSPDEQVISPTAVTNASITVFENGEAIIGFEQIHEGVYENSNFSPKPGYNYNITIDVPDFEQLTCQFNMPKIVTWHVLNHWVDSVVVEHFDAYKDSIKINDTSYYVYEIPAVNDTTTFCRIQFKVNDPVNEDNFYELSIAGCWMYFTESKEPNFEGTTIKGDNFYYAPCFDDKHYADEQQIITVNYTNASDTTFFEFASMDERQFENRLRGIRYFHSTNDIDPAIKPIIDIFNVDGVPDNEIVIFDPIEQSGGITDISYMSYYYDTIALIRPPENEWIIREGSKKK